LLAIMTRTARTALVTGASSGIGEAVTRRLAALGWDVIAGVRTSADGERIGADPSGRLRWVLLDVTDPAQVAAAAERVRAWTGDRGLRALVNNAGIAVGGPLEFVRPEDVRRQFDVNVFGLLRVTQAFLPMLRDARGRIVNIGSIAGRVPSPMVGPYCASKHAVESLSDSLRMELAEWGIAVSVVEPGVVHTRIWEKAARDMAESADWLPPRALALYDVPLRAMSRLVRRAMRTGSPPGLVADAVEHALTARHPRTRYVVTRDAKVRLRVQQLLPRRWMDALVLRTVRRLGTPAS